MKMTVVTIALCTALASLCAVPVPVDVTAETLAKIKGNTACAVAYPTSGGCTACIPSGTINVTYSYWMSGTYYTITTTVNVFAKCKAPTPDDMCMTDSTFLSNCTKASTPCPAGANLYMDNLCSNLVLVQPTTGPTCAPNYDKATVTPDTGLKCKGVMFGLF